MYKVVLLPKAEKTFVQANAPLARKLAKCFESLEIDPLRHPNIKPLLGSLKGFLGLGQAIIGLSIGLTLRIKPSM